MVSNSFSTALIFFFKSSIRVLEDEKVWLTASAIFCWLSKIFERTLFCATNFLYQTRVLFSSIFQNHSSSTSSSRSFAFWITNWTVAHYLDRHNFSHSTLFANLFSKIRLSGPGICKGGSFSDNLFNCWTASVWTEFHSRGDFFYNWAIQFLYLENFGIKSDM